ncbi:MAG: Holliday junction branch migration protein RuvA [Cytophagia bacterium]|nr:Holliday junction branch migration protein RuvA [Cytophagia bacterium]
MISFIKGKNIEISPTKLIVDVNGVGYEILISLRTYSKIKNIDKVNIFTHLNVKEDSHTLYGFYNKKERKTFLDLISISGVGPSTAIVILSSLSASELKKGIIESDVNKIKSVKGIGLKTAERIILELKDKISKQDIEDIKFVQSFDNTIRNEALSALSSLGISKNVVERHIDNILEKNINITLEELIREVLKKS